MKKKISFFIAIALLFSLTAVFSIQSSVAADPYYNEQWGVINSRIPELWDLTQNTKVRVGIIAAGIDATHEDLAGRVSTTLNRDFTGGANSDALTDTVGVGTQIAGIIGAVRNNGKGIAGIVDNVELISLKMFSKNPSTGAITASSNQLTNMINYANSNNIDILVYPQKADMIISGFKAAAASFNGLWVVSAGDDGIYYCNHGAGIGYDDTLINSYKPSNMLFVGNIDSNDNMHSTSNYCTAGHFDLNAPGTAIKTTIPGGYGMITSTLDSAAYIAGYAALLKSITNANINDIKSSIIEDNIFLLSKGRPTIEYAYENSRLTLTYVEGNYREIIFNTNVNTQLGLDKLIYVGIYKRTTLNDAILLILDNSTLNKSEFIAIDFVNNNIERLLITKSISREWVKDANSEWSLYNDPIYYMPTIYVEDYDYDGVDEICIYRDGNGFGDLQMNLFFKFDMMYANLYDTGTEAPAAPFLPEHEGTYVTSAMGDFGQMGYHGYYGITDCVGVVYCEKDRMVITKTNNKIYLYSVGIIPPIYKNTYEYSGYQYTNFVFTQSFNYTGDWGTDAGRFSRVAVMDYNNDGKDDIRFYCTDVNGGCGTEYFTLFQTEFGFVMGP